MLAAFALALPYLIIGLASDGPYAGRLLGGGALIIVVAALTSLWLLVRARRGEESQDERYSFLLTNAMRFSFLVTAVAVQAYWCWQFAQEGNAGDSSFWVLVALWASFLVGYGYNAVRH